MTNHDIKSNESHIIGSGRQRLRHGSYKTCYRDNRGYGRIYWRAEIQTISAGGVVRKRCWFKTEEEARAWLNGK